MEPLKIKDNSQNPKIEFADVKMIVNRVADKTLCQLEQEGVFVFPEGIKESEDLSKDQMILQSYNDMYISGNVMGFLGVEDERLIIESRFSKGDNDYFFRYLLEIVLEFPSYINLETNITQEEKLFNLLLFLFPRYLKKAIRKGLFKTYIRKEYNDGNVKGNIDIARHIKKNTPFVGKVAYSQREYSYDNYLIELVRHTIEYIKGKPRGTTILNTAEEEVKQIVQATEQYKVENRKKIIDANIKNVVRHAYYNEYRALQQLCILILRNEQHQYGNGSRKVYGVLFDGAWLWEEYVNSIIKKEFYHPKNKANTGAQKLFAQNFGLIYPDFISKNADERIIADAKYKPVKNIKNKDYFQVLAYMFRFDAKRGYYLYPESGENEDMVLRMNRGSTYEKVEPREDVMLIKHGLKIPQDVKDYADFVEKIKVSEKEFGKIFS